MTVYSSSTSLILTDLLTRGQNYSFAVAVTDSTGQYGPQLMVTYDGKIIITLHFDDSDFLHAVPEPVFNISYQLNQATVISECEV